MDNPIKEIHSRITASTKEVAASDDALKRFIHHIGEVDAKLKAILAKVEDHNNLEPGQVNWGHVGDLAYVNEQLSNIMEFLEIK